MTVHGKLNPREAVVARELENEGWEIFHRGWPDFLAVRGDKVRFIEVKNYIGDASDLYGVQRRVAQVLAKIGIEVELQSPSFTEKDRIEMVADIDEAFAEMAEASNAYDTMRGAE